MQNGKTVSLFQETLYKLSAHSLLKTIDVGSIAVVFASCTFYFSTFLVYFTAGIITQLLNILIVIGEKQGIKITSFTKLQQRVSKFYIAVSEHSSTTLN